MVSNREQDSNFVLILVEMTSAFILKISYSGRTLNKRDFLKYLFI